VFPHSPFRTRRARFRAPGSPGIGLPSQCYHWACHLTRVHCRPGSLTGLPVGPRFPRHEQLPDGFPVLRVLWRLRRPGASLGDCTPPRMGLPRSQRCPLPTHVGGDLLLTPAALCGIPTDQRVIQVNLWDPLGWYPLLTFLGHPMRCGRCPIRRGLEAGALFPVGLSSPRCLTLCVLSQARLLGGLPRAAPVPFRASSFSPGVHPPGATAQRPIACLYRPWRFPLMTSLRLVAHSRNRATRSGQ
jgi:hypothetical protein